MMAKAIAKDDGFTDIDLMTPAPVERLDDVSFDELMANSSLAIEDIDEVSLTDKETLLNTPMVILAWKFSQGDFGEFVSVRARTPKGLVVFTDGSTGIYQQMYQYQERIIKSGKWDEFVKSGLLIHRGLRKSEYTYTDDDGREVPAVTYYFDNRTS